MERIALLEWLGLGEVGGIQYLGGGVLDVNNTLSFKLSDLRGGAGGKQR
jgi:hypothetical protein